MPRKAKEDKVEEKVIKEVIEPKKKVFRVKVMIPPIRGVNEMEAFINQAIAEVEANGGKIENIGVMNFYMKSPRVLIIYSKEEK